MLPISKVLTNLSIGAVSACMFGQVEHYEIMTKVLKDDGLCTAMQRPASYSSSKVSHKSPDTLAAAASTVCGRGPDGRVLILAWLRLTSKKKP